MTGDRILEESVIRAMAKWPNVPAIYGWLALDRRGRWLLQGQPVTHPRSVAFINANFGHDNQGRWFFQNGPQRVFVDLAYTPWIVEMGGDGRWHTHTGVDIARLDGVYLDDGSDVLMACEHGVALVHDRDLHALAELLDDGAGHPPDPDAVETWLAGAATPMWLSWDGRRTPFATIARAEVAARFGFDPRPRPRDPAG